VLEEAEKNKEYHGMGTTLTVAIFKDSKIHIGHVGDSRVYLINSNGLKKITNDHSYTAELVKSGTISVDEAKIHPNRNVITRAIGASSDLVVDLINYASDEGDIYLMCTDGLTNMIKQDDILNIIERK
jgi:serine/threonine protein phosphatase PrpC